MRTNSTSNVLTPAFLILCGLAFAGCEGWNRQHDYAVVDVKPPAEDEYDRPRAQRVNVNLPDLVENMMSARQAYLNSIAELEKSFLMAGDSNRADWARRQRSNTAGVEVFPYISDKAPEQRVEVVAEQSVAEADALFNKAVAIYNDVSAIPLAGTLPHNKKKAREALDMFKKLLSAYPRSDKVDDAAFYTGEIYKEYLREDDPNDEMAIRYYKWAFDLNPKTPHPARFQCAVVYDFRRHNRDAALELYHKVLDLEENNNQSNVRFSATRIEQLSDEDFSHVRPEQPRDRPGPSEPKPGNSSDIEDESSNIKPASSTDRPVKQPARAP
ncbi:MAG: tetratricopeptide repeat protein [Planctomycetota bacterium]